MRKSINTFLPSPLSVSHPANNGEVPIYVYDSNPIGGRHYDQIRLAEASFDVTPGHVAGPAGAAYAIPTRRSHTNRPVSWSVLKSRIAVFCDYAKSHPKKSFQVTRIGGCRSSAFLDEHAIAELFIDHCPGNLHLPGSWERLRDPSKRRVCIVSATTKVSDEDEEAVRWLLQNQNDVEIVVPGAPLQYKPAMRLADRLGVKACLFTAEAPSISGHSWRLMEELSWYSDYAVIIKPANEAALSKTEKDQLARLDLFYKCIVENKIGVRSITAGSGLTGAPL